MKKKLIPLFLLFPLSFTWQGPLNSTSLLQTMYARYHGKWHTSLSFDQTTEKYRNDSLVKTQTWFENMVYPDLLRIDFDQPNSGNGVLFRNDSTYAFSNHQLIRSVYKENELIFFLGGLYFMPFDQVVTHFKSLKYDLNKFHTDTLKGRPVYVMGADKKGEQVNQLWIDQQKLVAVYFARFDESGKLEGYFEDHIPLKNAWSETKCTFYLNNHLLQVETYRHVVAGGAVDKSRFAPWLFGK